MLPIRLALALAPRATASNADHHYILSAARTLLIVNYLVRQSEISVGNTPR
jgi:hypothetical protein